MKTKNKIVINARLRKQIDTAASLNDRTFEQQANYWMKLGLVTESHLSEEEKIAILSGKLDFVVVPVRARRTTRKS